MYFMYATEHLTFIFERREEGKTWQEVTNEFNAYFRTDKTKKALKNAYYYHQAGTAEKIDVDLLRATRSARKANVRVRREANLALDALNDREDILDAIQSIIKKLPKIKAPKIPKIETEKDRNTTLELMFSDIHYGKKTAEVNLKKIRDRVRQTTSALIFKAKNEAKTYNVKEIIVACLGDVIESASMHGEESLRGCEFGNAQQIAHAIESMYLDLLKPLAETGFPITFIGVPGNHDRIGKNRTYHNPGEERMTWIIFKSLELLCQEMQMNVKFVIPVQSFITYNIYGSNYLYEHCYNVKPTKDACENHIKKRQVQLGILIDGLRGGHWHELCMFGRGRVIINESIVGPDSFSIELGFASEAGQVINQYIETNNRPTPFYQMFPVYLK